MTLCHYLCGVDTATRCEFYCYSFLTGARGFSRTIYDYECNFIKLWWAPTTMWRWIYISFQETPELKMWKSSWEIDESKFIHFYCQLFLVSQLWRQNIQHWLISNLLFHATEQNMCSQLFTLIMLATHDELNEMTHSSAQLENCLILIGSRYQYVIKFQPYVKWPLITNFRFCNKIRHLLCHARGFTRIFSYLQWHLADRYRTGWTIYQRRLKCQKVRCRR